MTENSYHSKISTNMISEKVNFVSIPRTGTRSIHTLIEGDNHKSIRLTKDERFSFAVIRHPLKRLISWWQYHSHAIYDPTGEIYGETFREWANNGFKHHWSIEKCESLGIDSPLRQSDFVCDYYNKVIVDTLLNYDNLQQEFDVKLQPFLIVTKLPHLNEGNKTKVASINTQLLDLTFNIFQMDWAIYNTLK